MGKETCNITDRKCQNRPAVQQHIRSVSQRNPDGHMLMRAQDWGETHTHTGLNERTRGTYGLIAHILKITFVN